MAKKEKADMGKVKFNGTEYPLYGGQGGCKPEDTKLFKEKNGKKVFVKPTTADYTAATATEKAGWTVFVSAPKAPKAAKGELTVEKVKEWLTKAAPADFDAIKTDIEGIAKHRKAEALKTELEGMGYTVSAPAK